MSVPVGEALIGRVVNALGQPIDGAGPIETTEFRPIESPAASASRYSYRPFSYSATAGTLMFTR